MKTKMKHLVKSRDFHKTRTLPGTGFIIIVSLMGCKESSTQVFPIGQPLSSNWTLIKESSDEFNGLSLDITKWDTKPGYTTSGVFAFKSDNIEVSGGNLILSAKKENFNEKSYTSAFLQSKFSDSGNGSFVEVRAKTTDVQANICCAIWEQNFPLLQALDPNPEIDIQEYLLSGANGNPKRVQSTLHRWYIPSGHSMDAYKTFDTTVPLCDDFHIYGLERREGKLSFYLDGNNYWEYTVTSMPEYVNMSRHIIFSIEGHAGNPVDSYLPAVFQIDYVRIYRLVN
jgi:beta-glucanase (GH16 family)